LGLTNLKQLWRLIKFVGLDFRDLVLNRTYMRSISLAGSCDIMLTFGCPMWIRTYENNNINNCKCKRSLQADAEGTGGTIERFPRHHLHINHQTPPPL